jgi:UDP-glucuronate decarboxylase
MKKTILVTGGAGFLGSHLCEKLLAQSNEVICLDDLSTGQLDNIAHLISNPLFKFIKHDVTIPIDLKVDQIYNLACPASPIYYQYDPVKTVTTNVYGAINLLNLARRCGATILQASTSEVYGDPEVHPQPEEYWGKVNPIGLRSCYDEGKRCAETLFFDYKRQYGIKIKVARIFNTYGPRMHPDDGRVVSNFIVQSLHGNDIQVYGDGKQTRSFCYVDDLILGLITLMGTADHETGPINLGNPVEFQMVELAEMVKRLTKSQSQIVYQPLPSDDPRFRCPDIAKAISLLNWKPAIDLEAGLINTIDYFRTRLNL